MATSEMDAEPHLQKHLFLQKDRVGGVGKESLCCFLGQAVVQNKTNAPK